MKKRHGNIIILLIFDQCQIEKLNHVTKKINNSNDKNG